MVAIYVPWWMWVVLGMVLLLGEVLTPGGFFIIFFGAAALVVGLLKALGLEMALSYELMLFAILSIMGLVFFRKPLQQKFRQLTPDILPDELKGESGTALEEIAAGAAGKVELRGTAWSAVNAGVSTLPKGCACLVEKVDGLTLTVRAK
ncbi:MAG TPA: NfeD family protein [Bryobacteraceae bacterium]|nr:NfeD family protein [Bryobacteraceae bacterium]